MGASEYVISYTACDAIKAVRRVSVHEKEQAMIRATVSWFASTSTQDFIGEVYAGLLAGRNYPVAVMKIYWRLKGPEPMTGAAIRDLPCFACKHFDWSKSGLSVCRLPRRNPQADPDVPPRSFRSLIPDDRGIRFERARPRREAKASSRVLAALISATRHCRHSSPSPSFAMGALFPIRIGAGSVQRSIVSREKVDRSAPEAPSEREKQPSF